MSGGEIVRLPGLARPDFDSSLGTDASPAVPDAFRDRKTVVIKFVEGHPLLLVDNCYCIYKYIKAKFQCRYYRSPPKEICSIVRPHCWAIYTGTPSRAYAIARELIGEFETSKSKRATAIEVRSTSYIFMRLYMQGLSPFDPLLIRAIQISTTVD